MEKLTKNERGILHDLIAVNSSCATCKRKTCPEWCLEFTREQLREINEHVQNAEYVKIYA